jgi:hypothetical protein
LLHESRDLVDELLGLLLELVEEGVYGRRQHVEHVVDRPVKISLDGDVTVREQVPCTTKKQHKTIQCSQYHR